MNAVDEFTAALLANGQSQRGRKWTCPAHEDRNPSMTVSSGREGRVLVKCFAGCDARQIVDALGMEWTDLFEEPREVARYPYRAADGAVLNRKIRFSNKEFVYEKPMNGTRLPLYNLPEVIAGIQEDRRIWLVEGEKDAERLTSAGEIATTNPNGSSDWCAEYGDLLAGAEVVIVADRDDPGLRHADEVRADLKGKARSVRVVQSRTERKGDDVSDHLDAGYTLDELVPCGVAGKYRPVNWAEVWAEEAPPVEWLLEPILERGTLNALFGKPGAGKSLVTLEMCLRIIRAGMRVMMVDHENRVVDLVERLRAFGAHPKEMRDLIVFSFTDLPPLDTVDGGRHLAALVDEYAPDLVTLDTTSRLVEGNENDAATFLALYRCSLVPLKGRGTTVLRLDHPGKELGRGQRGSSAKDGDVDSIWKLERDSEEVILLERTKTRSGHGAGTVILQMHSDPLRFDWDPCGQLVDAGVIALAKRLDKLSVPLDWGRDRVRTKLEEHRVTAGNAQLSAAMKYRRDQTQQLSVDSFGRVDSMEEPWWRD